MIRFVLGLSLCAFTSAVLCAQNPAAQHLLHVYSGTVLGPGGQTLGGIDIQLEIEGHSLSAVSGTHGDFRITTKLSGPVVVKILIPGFAPFQGTVLPDRPARLNLALSTNVERVVVTADRTPLALDSSANIVRVLTGRELQKSAAVTLGDKVRQVTGVHFFRRSSTLVANPTSQGVSLRGLGSTAASRSLVLANGVPINDPFGSWIYWDQIPTLAVANIEVVDGGVSDLYGSNAIGGAINIVERQPRKTEFALDTGYAGYNTPHVFVLGTTRHGPWSGMAAGDFLRTDGYIQIGPDERGPVDTPANLHYQNGEVYARRSFAHRGAAYLRGDILNEARGNGTPLQTNGTRLWRYTGGTDWTAEKAGIFALTLFGSTEHYRQSFSAVPADQSIEFLTRLQHVSAQQLGGAAQWTKALFPWLTLLAGESVNDIRATDYEVPVYHSLPNGLSDTTARQRDIGEYGEALLQIGNWSLSGSARLDTFLNLDATQYMRQGDGPINVMRILNRTENVLNPKLAVVRSLDRYISWNASAYRAFRAPSMNELYRRSQVGQEITLPNFDLRSERATGWETGAQFNLPGRNTSVRAGYFWTEVNRPVTALTLQATPSQILKQRENLGQIRSRGVELNYETQPLSWLNVTGGYQYANATVTQFTQNPNLVGKWIPQVPHNTATLQLRAAKSSLGTAALMGKLSGRQYDDDANMFLLHGYFQMDAYVSHAFDHRVEVYASVVNVFDRAIQVGRTPILTLGTPRTASVGLRIHSPSAVLP